jgi:hypothetical protein
LIFIRNFYSKHFFCNKYLLELHIQLWWENLRERDHLEDVGLDGRIILEWIIKKWLGMDWIYVAEDRD